MEEKRPGQQPEADRKRDPAQNRVVDRSAREGGRAKGGFDPTAQDLELVRAADARGKRTAGQLKAGGFGDHKGVDGFPELPRED